MNLGMENETLEFKKSTSELDKAVISISSMLNKHGEGTVYFGVKNNGDIIGQKDANDNSVRDISRKIAEGIKPQIIPTITMEYLNELKVIKVSVKGNNRPYSAFGLFYMRSFDEDKQISPELISNIINIKGELDLIITEPTIRKDLTFRLLKNLYSINGYQINEQHFEENTHLLTLNGRYNYMAELLSDENDISIKVVTFKGRDKSIVLKRTEYGYKCLLVAIEQVIQFMESINETKVKIGGFQRKEEDYFDIDCFKEAWVNACAHTRWIEKIPPAVYIFDDRIEIVSNGGLPKALSKDDFFKGVSKPINQELLNILTKLDIIDQTGHGIPKIVRKYGEQAFYISDHTIIVTIPINKELLEKESINNGSVSGSVSGSVKNNKFNLIFNKIKENPYITRLELKELLNIPIRTIDNNIKRLKEKGYIERVGSDKTGYWKILK